MRRLRSVELAVYLTTGSAYTTTADRLHIHPNTVKYRIQKAEEKLRVPSSDGRVDVTVALVLCEQLGSSVLALDHEQQRLSHLLRLAHSAARCLA